MMRRDECLKILNKHRGDNAIAVCVYNAAFDWRRISQSPLNYYSVGAMGQGSSHALGIALAMPDYKVIVLDGDGSLLMNLGSLVTVAAAAPPNYYHFVCENGDYEANGSHPIPAPRHGELCRARARRRLSARFRIRRAGKIRSGDSQNHGPQRAGVHHTQSGARRKIGARLELPQFARDAPAIHRCAGGRRRPQRASATMRPRRLRAGWWLAAATAFVVISTTASAQDFPANPIKIIVPFAAGGSIDVLARRLQPKLESELGKPIIVENRPGASTQLGTIDVARAAPDGYTILFASDSHVINQVFNKKPPYDAVRDFAPLSLLGAFSERVLRQSIGRRSDAARRHRAHQTGAGQAQLRLDGAGHDRLSRDGVSQTPRRARSRLRAVSRRRAGDAGGDRRRGAVCDFELVHRPRRPRVEQNQGDCRYRPETTA